MIELSPRQIPNLITLARIALVFPTTWLLWEARYVEGMILMSIAGASDALDGWLARKFSWGSRFGAAMDPVADKLLVAAMFLVFSAMFSSISIADLSSFFTSSNTTSLSGAPRYFAHALMPI